MLAAVISDPRAVTLRWLRLTGIIALSMAGLAAFFAGRRINVALVASMLLILGQLAFVQVGKREIQRALSLLSTIALLIAAVQLVPLLVPMSWPILGGTFFVAAAVSGLSLMDMLLGHAYLNAAEMTMSPFRRLNLALIAAIALRAILSIPIALLLHRQHPDDMFWNLHGLYIGTRWLVGLLVPGVFVFMAHDCIKRRATQSATGILYVAGVLFFIGEIIGLYLIGQTGLTL